MANLGGAQPCTVTDPEGGATLEPRTRHGGQQVGHLLHAENHGQLAGLSMELHEPLHLFAPAGDAEEEPQRDDAHVEAACGYSLIGHLKLIGAQVFRRGRVWRSPAMVSSQK